MRAPSLVTTSGPAGCLPARMNPGWLLWKHHSEGLFLVGRPHPAKIPRLGSGGAEIGGMCPLAAQASAAALHASVTSRVHLQVISGVPAGRATKPGRRALPPLAQRGCASLSSADRLYAIYVVCICSIPRLAGRLTVAPTAAAAAAAPPPQAVPAITMDAGWLAGWLYTRSSHNAITATVLACAVLLAVAGGVSCQAEEGGNASSSGPYYVISAAAQAGSAQPYPRGCQVRPVRH